MAIATSETVSGTATAANSVATASWTPAANDCILVWVACRSGVTAASVAGNGITFVQVLSDTESPQNQCTLSLWRGMAASPSAGAITATLSGTATAAVIQAHRISGADTSGANGAGAIGASAIANTGASDTSTPSVALTTTAPNSRVYGGATHRTQAYSTGTGETAIALNVTAGTAGDVTSLSTEYQDVASASSVTIDGTLASAIDWIQGAVEVLVLAVVAKSGTDSGALSEAASLGVAPSGTDSGALSEAASLGVAPSRTDSGALADASSVTVTISVVDAGSFSDAASVADLGTLLQRTEAGTLSDAAALAASVPGADSGALSDAAALAAALSRSDSGTLTEVAIIAQARADSGALAEAVALAAGLSRTDSGTLSEAALVMLVIVLSPTAALTLHVPAGRRTASVPADPLRMRVAREVRGA
ncbi:MAG: hypothetical protein IPK75_17790 [Acidobacteria bacterium]|nr:hypothetical protein [Acidobacteriota bacterium]